eukprot:4550522-Alexandrium_andersonii.AAC.1
MSSALRFSGRAFSKRATRLATWPAERDLVAEAAKATWRAESASLVPSAAAAAAPAVCEGRDWLAAASAARALACRMARCAACRAGAAPGALGQASGGAATREPAGSPDAALP